MVKMLSSGVVFTGGGGVCDVGVDGVVGVVEVVGVVGVVGIGGGGDRDGDSLSGVGLGLLGLFVGLVLLRSPLVATVSFKGARKPLIFQTPEPGLVSTPFACMKAKVSVGIEAIATLFCLAG